MRVGLLLVLGLAAVAYAAYAPQNVTHHVLVAVTETLSPTADTRDRPLIEFTDPDGNLLVVNWEDATRSLTVVQSTTGATVTTTT